MRAADWPVVRAIYEQGIATGDATFDTQAPDWEHFDAGHLEENVRATELQLTDDEMRLLTAQGAE